MEVEELGGFADVPAGAAEDGFDVFLFALGFEVAQGDDGGGFGDADEAALEGLAGGGHGGRELVDGHGVGAEDGEALGDVAELADVAGPGVGGEGVVDGGLDGELDALVAGAVVDFFFWVRVISPALFRPSCWCF